MKGTTRKISQKGGLLNVLAPVTKVALTVIKIVLRPLPTSALVPLGIATAAPVTDSTIKKKILDQGWQH